MIVKLFIADYIVIIVFLVTSCWIGIFYAYKDRHYKKLESAFVGNRKFKMFPIACSLLVTQISAISILGMPAEFYTRGAQYFIFIVGQWLGVIFAIILFIPVFHKVGSPSSFTYLQERFQSKILRCYCVLTFMITQLLYASVVLFAPCLAISLIIPLSINQLILIIGTVCTFYTAIGGFKTVIVTDLFQFSIIFISIFLLLIKGLKETGGFLNVYQTAKKLNRLGQTFEFNPDPTIYQSVWNIFFGIFFLTLRSYGIYQPSIQRYVSMPTIKKAQISTLLVLPMQLFLIFVLSTIGFLMLTAYYSCDPLKLQTIKKKDLLLSLFAMQTLNKIPGLNGLFLACLFSGSLSTLSSSLNSLAAVFWEDFIFPLLSTNSANILNIPSYQGECLELNNIQTPNLNKFNNKHTNKFSRIFPPLLTLFFGVIVIGLSFMVQNVEGILNAALFALSVFGGQATAIFFVGMFIKFANYKGVLAGKFVADVLCLLITCGFLKYSKHIVPPYLPINNFNDSSNYSLPYCQLQKHLSSNDSHLLNINHMNFTLLDTKLSIEKEHSILFKIYSISYLLLTPLGFFICLFVATLISYVTGGTKLNLKYEEKRLLHPWVQN